MWWEGEKREVETGRGDKLTSGPGKRSKEGQSRGGREHEEGSQGKGKRRAGKWARERHWKVVLRKWKEGKVGR